MRTLLRKKDTGLYFQGPDQWTTDPERAYDFRFIDRAVSFAQTWELKQVEFAFAFDNPEWVTAVSFERTALRFAAA
jgi:hypothetical protein